MNLTPSQHSPGSFQVTAQTYMGIWGLPQTWSLETPPRMPNDSEADLPTPKRQKM